VFFR